MRYELWRTVPPEAVEVNLSNFGIQNLFMVSCDVVECMHACVCVCQCVPCKGYRGRVAYICRIDFPNSNESKGIITQII